MTELLLTCATAAGRLGISSRRVRQLIAAGRLRALKHGRDWLIREADLARVAVRKPGRPVTKIAAATRRPRS
jgi:excisionase family DNA binding protein